MAININAKTTGVGGLETSADNSGNINIQSGGSTVMSVTSSGVAVTGSFSQNGAVYSTQPTFRNLIINGDMRIAQRGTSVAGIGGNGLNTVDRFTRELSAGGNWTMSQDADVPPGQGFAYSMKYLCTTANASLGSSSYFLIESRNEGQNFQHLKYGTANAESVTLSFWVKTNKTGTYTLEAFQADANRNKAHTYTINSANTWEKKIITIGGDTSGVINNDNGDGYRISWWLVAGTDFTSGTLATSWSNIVNANRVSSSQVNLADSTSNYINITGVQLEVGSTATEFEHLPVDVELARCQRYYQKIEANTSQYFDSGWVYTSSNFAMIHTWTVPMRIAPTSMDTTGTASDYRVAYAATGTPCTSIPNLNQTGVSAARIHFPTASVLTVGHAAAGFTNSSNAYLGFSAEL